MEERILNKATEQFFSFGLRSVTMDALASELGISKKTVYRYFSDKDQLVARVVTGLLNDHSKEMECCRIKATNAVQEVGLQVEAILNLFLRIKPGFFNEVQKYYPGVWCNIMSHEKDALFDGIQRNLKKGVLTGLFRPEININITAFFRLNQLRSLFTPSLYEVAYYDIRELAYELTNLYLHGITTTEGKQLINTNTPLQSQ